jgi:hypothetical protein
LDSRCEFSGKLLIIDMPGRFGQQQGGVRFQSASGFGEEWTWPRHFMHHGKGEHEVNSSFKVAEGHRRRRNHAGIDVVE